MQNVSTFYPKKNATQTNGWHFNNKTYKNGNKGIDAKPRPAFKKNQLKAKNVKSLFRRSYSEPLVIGNETEVRGHFTSQRAGRRQLQSIDST